MARGDADVRRQLLLGAAMLAVVRLVLTLWRPGPVVLVDEIGYLTNARVLAGGQPAELLTTPFYRGGYSLVLAPLMTVVDDPETVYRLALAVNVALAASLFPLLYLMLVRCFATPRRIALWAAFAGAAYPSLTPTTGAAMSENLLLPFTVVWLLAFGGLLDESARRACAGWAAAFGGLAAALWAIHGRMLVTVVLSGIALVVLALRRRLDVGLAAIGLVCLGGGSLGAVLLNDFLVRENYGGRDFDEAGSRLSDAGEVDGALTVAGNLIGQTWYLIVATLGLALLVPFVQRRPGPVGGLLLVTTAGLIAISALSFAEITRADMLVYGRYVEVVAPPLVAVGLAGLTQRRGRLPAGAVMATVLALTVVVAGLRAGLDPSGPPSFWNVQSLPLRTELLGAGGLLAAGIGVSVAAGALVLVARRYPGLLVPAVLLLFLPPTALAERSLMRRSQDVYPSGWQSIEAAAAGRDIGVIAYDDAHRDLDGQFIYPWFLRDSTVVHFAPGTPPPSRYVISSGSWLREHPDTSATVVWRDPVRDQVRWRLGARTRASR